MKSLVECVVGLGPIRRLMCSERLIRSKWRTVACVAVLLGALLPLDRAASDEPKATEAFELLIVGPDGKPVPAAEAEFRTKPIPGPEAIKTGEFVRQGAFGTVVKADAEGRIRIDLPEQPESYFSVFIRTAGFGPYCAEWSIERNETIPARFVAELDAAWSVGGVFVDADGKPVAGVTVRPNILFKKRPEDRQPLGSGASVTSDERGRWRFDSVPVSLHDVNVELVHSGFKPERRSLSRAEFGFGEDGRAVAKIVLDRGITVTGKVTDEEGRPIAGALIRTRLFNTTRQATTDDDGTYRLSGCDERITRLVVSAKGRARTCGTLTTAMDPVDFRLSPGGKIRVRVLDENGKGIPRARIFFQRWRTDTYSYFEFGHVNQYADENGVWEWDEAPLDEIRADIVRPDGMQLRRRPLVAREEEYVFRPPPALVVSGKVIDSQTKEPIARFHAVPGTLSDGRPSEEFYWMREQRSVGTDGSYSVRETSEGAAHAVRIEAEGYKPAESRRIRSDEGNVSIDFQLESATLLTARIVSPDLRPAARAKVTVNRVGGRPQIFIPELDRYMSRTDIPESDADGMFRFAVPEGDFKLFIVHPSGWAYANGEAERRVRIVRLEPWVRVEGRFHVGSEPAGNVPLALELMSAQPAAGDAFNLIVSQATTTQKDGSFVFERVFPGEGRIGRRVHNMADQGAEAVASWVMPLVNFPAGKTTHLDLGGTGRAVIGKLQPPEAFTGETIWNFAFVYVTPKNPAEQRIAPRIGASVARDGTFRIDDVPPGSYSMRIDYQRDRTRFSLMGHELIVPAGDEPAKGPIDVGNLKAPGHDRSGSAADQQTLSTSAFPG